MVFFLLIFARYLGVSRRQHSFGIALGFSIFAVMELGIISSWAAHDLSDASMGVVNMVAYNSALLIWLGYALKSPASCIPRPISGMGTNSDRSTAFGFFGPDFRRDGESGSIALPGRALVGDLQGIKPARERTERKHQGAEIYLHPNFAATGQAEHSGSQSTFPGRKYGKPVEARRSLV
jgi:hypothetical protein